MKNLGKCYIKGLGIILDFGALKHSMNQNTKWIELKTREFIELTG